MLQTAIDMTGLWSVRGEDMKHKRRLSQVVEISGHIIDSLVLPRILDELIDLGAEFAIQRLNVGRSRTDPSYARIEIAADSAEALQQIVNEVQRLGAVPVHIRDVEVQPAPADGVFPESFY
ncbi:MAG: hypothetical protein HY675_26720, partial [Chloroflexi bacterium]|nr:hypothetical protein [Chloroflexota bacterium]